VSVPPPRLGRVAIVAARWNEAVTRRLLEGAQACCLERGITPDRVDVVWGAGAWELPVLVRGLLGRGTYAAVIALGAVVRGETPHFDYIAGETARGLMTLQIEYGIPVGFGVLTCDTMDQALARAGGAAGNKGHEAASAALDVAAALDRHAGPR
jgi:6,7-dimethyl-8-ribityllumazine synthase